MGLLNLDQAHQALDGAGDPAPHAQRFVYLAGTAALAPLYKDADLTVRQANPMTSNALGEFDLCYLVDGSYKVLIKSEHDVILLEQDDVKVGSAMAIGVAAIFHDAAELLDDTVLSYTGETGHRRIIAGEIVQVASGDFTYRVAASDAVDHHRITAGEVKLYVEPGANGYNVKAFGAQGDATTDDSAAIQAAINTGGAVLFPHGTYLANGLLLNVDN